MDRPGSPEVPFARTTPRRACNTGGHHVADGPFALADRIHGPASLPSSGSGAVAHCVRPRGRRPEPGHLRRSPSSLRPLSRTHRRQGGLVSDGKGIGRGRARLPAACSTLRSARRRVAKPPGPASSHQREGTRAPPAATASKTSRMGSAVSSSSAQAIVAEQSRTRLTSSFVAVGFPSIPASPGVRVSTPRRVRAIGGPPPGTSLPPCRPQGLAGRSIGFPFLVIFTSSPRSASAKYHSNCPWPRRSA